MRRLIPFAFLVLLGCGDTITAPCDKARIPPAPHEDAVRSMQRDKLLWTWTVRDGKQCLTMSEVWVWKHCSWEFDKLIKTQSRCKDDDD